MAGGKRGRKPQADPTPATIAARARKIRKENDRRLLIDGEYAALIDVRPAGEKALLRQLVAYSVDAVREFERRFRNADGMRRYQLLDLADDAFRQINWLLSPDTCGMPFFSFNEICTILDCDPQMVRERILERIDPEAVRELLRISAADPGEDAGQVDADEAAA